MFHLERNPNKNNAIMKHANGSQFVGEIQKIHKFIQGVLFGTQP
jgi:hypothetical protein